MNNSLAKDPLPDVKDVFNIVSKEESHRGLHPGSGSKVQPVAFVVKFNNFKGNDFKWGFNNANKGPNPNILTANVVLFDILVVLEYSVSLLYVHKLIRDSKLFVCFDEHKRYIHDLNMVKTMGTGNESGSLYLFDVEQFGKSNVGLSNPVFVFHVSKQSWHNRLDYPFDQVMSILSKSIGLKYDKHILPCDIC
ncbi:hypothetical protein Tco_1455810 [Tanacetum coccineum]